VAQGSDGVKVEPLAHDPEKSSRAAVLAGRHPFPYAPEMAPAIVRALELGAILIAGLLLWLLPQHYRPEYASHHVFCVGFIAIAYAALTNWAGLHTVNALMRPVGVADNVVVAVITCFCGLLTILFGLDVAYLLTPSWLAAFFGATLASALAIRFAAFKILRQLSQRRIVGRNLAVLGVGAQSAQFLRKLSRDPPYFTALVGVFDVEEHTDLHSFEGAAFLGSIDDLLANAREGLIDDVVVAMPWSADKTVISVIERLSELPVNIYLASDLVGFDLNFRPVLASFSQLPVYEVKQRPISGWSSALKALLDYSVALTALLLLSPLLLLIAALIKLDSPGPVFFVQKRLGFNSKPFSIYKFRSMIADADRGPVVKQATRDDPRITRVGRIIRATSLDELPQLLNVLDGTMSLVGPRPHALSHNEEYGRQIRGYFARHKVKPGITGWAQVNGLRGETTDLERMRRRIEHDIYYTENWSLLFDVKIIVTTLIVVLFQKAAY
jgi:Undecaprenyl-phosphate glucose phosphotransferase